MKQVRPDQTNRSPEHRNHQFLEESRIIELDDAVLVDNAWSAPAASGCGGLLSSVIDPIINLASGLPAKAGTNSAILKNDISATTTIRSTKTMPKIRSYFTSCRVRVPELAL